MLFENDKLNSLFRELENIKETYVELSVGSLDKKSKMNWTEYKKEYEKLGEIIEHSELQSIQLELVEEVIYSILEMLDGYKSLNFEADIIDKKTGESITKNIQLHDKYRDHIEAKKLV
ncbi:hypothetical protein QNH28_24175 [Paenibacillus sp. G2S3]|uniref:hypothetical protein n=1 Tax=Paenibacillus sp. G2S3 TaxID=3047872 RepID=UPI0024C10B3E|nr:hypothetical protein [Paenibacillus sp. G2S3]WHY18531.1 hypothetical protein QNH28_24175 [Paenibacillus sp. G2S3]